MQLISYNLGASSYAEYDFATSSPPFGGNCQISPSNGTSLITVFEVNCKNWMAMVGSVNYRVLLKSGNLDDSSNRQLLTYGPNETMVILLPAGWKEDDYQVYVSVEILDLIGTFVKSDLNVKVISK